MKVLVLGAGRMGTIRVTDLVEDPRVTEVYVANRNEERAQKLALEYGAIAVSWSEAFSTPADATIVAVGTDAHEQALRTVLPHGQPVLCEKPIALTLEATQELIELADEHNTPFQIGFQRRFDDAIRGVYESIAEGKVGTLYSMTMTAHDHTPSPREFIAGSGGIFRDLHVHDFDLIRWLTDSEIASVYATSAVRQFTEYAEFDDADVTAINLVTTSGVQVTVSGTRHDALGHDVRLEVFGSTDSLSAGLNSRTPLHTMEGDLGLMKNPYLGFVDRFREAFRNETHAFVSFALGEIANPCPPDSALESMRIAVACERSIATGLPVTMTDIPASS